MSTAESLEELLPTGKNYDLDVCNPNIILHIPSRVTELFLTDWIQRNAVYGQRIGYVRVSSFPRSQTLDLLPGVDFKWPRV